MSPLLVAQRLLMLITFQPLLFALKKTANA